MIKKYFGRIRKSTKEIPQVYTTEPAQEGQRTVTLKRAGQQGIVGLAHKSPSATHEDAASFIVLSSILSSGKNSRFYKNITDKGLTTNIFIWDSLFKDPGLFAVYANLAPGVEHKAVEDALVAEYESIKKGGVTDEEVSKAKAQLVASMKFRQDGSMAVAGSLNEAIASGDWTLYTRYEDLINSVTAESIKEIVNKYFLEDLSTVGYFIPEISGSQAERKPAISAKELVEMKKQYFSKEDQGGLAGQVVDSEPVEGIRLLTLKRGSGVVTINGSFMGGDIYADDNNSRVPDLVSSMLDQGTTKQTKFEISNQLEKAGARLNISNGKSNVGFSAKFLSNDLEMVFGLLSEQLQSPAFNKEDLEKIKKRMVTNYKKRKESTRGRAVNNMLTSLYPGGHQNAPQDNDKSIEDINKTTTEDLKAFHKQNYGKGGMVIVAVGDVDHEQLSNTIKKEFGAWKNSPLSKKLETKKGKKLGKKVYVTMEDKTSTDLVVGIPLGINKFHEDYMPLIVASHILGGNFSARLMQTVRVKEGLTYGINSAITGFDNNNDGYWMVGGTFAPELLAKGEKATLREIKKWAEEGVTQAEVDITKSTLMGSYQVGFDTTYGLSSGILSAVNVWGDLSYVDSYPGKVGGVTLDQVNKAIKKYISFNDIYQVAAGSIDKEGTPIKKQ
jgi:zinc protease